MGIEIRQVGPEDLARYGEISIRFTVESVFRVEQVDGGLGGLLLKEERINEPYVKNYDAYEPEGPTRWAKRFDVSNWGFLLAFDGAQPAGGAVLAFRTPNVHMLEGRSDLAVLWDIRVCPERRGEGVGTRLFEHAVAWARQRDCRQLRAETQNVNVPACRFYARQGCRLGVIDCYGYAGDPRVAHETMLLWYFDL